MKTKEELEAEIAEAEEAERLAALEGGKDLDEDGDGGVDDDSTGNNDDAGDDDGEGKPTPAWMAEEDEEEGEPEPDGENVGTIRALARERKKKQKAKEESSQLREENEKLKQQLAQGATVQELGPKPKLIDFDSDDDYEVAFSTWHDQKSTAGQSAAQANNTQAEEMARYGKRIETSYDDHIGRADNFVKEHNIKADVFQQAEESVVDLIVDVAKLPNGADKQKAAELYLHSMIDVVGVGSEKVVYLLKVNQKARKEFAAIVATDANGLKVAAWLGAKAAELNGFKEKKRSNAPKPAAQTKSNGAGTQTGKSLKKKFDAIKETDMNGAMDLRRQAKKLKVDVSTWT